MLAIQFDAPYASPFQWVDDWGDAGPAARIHVESPGRFVRWIEVLSQGSSLQAALSRQLSTIGCRFRQMHMQDVGSPEATKAWRLPCLMGNVHCAASTRAGRMLAALALSWKPSIDDHCFPACRDHARKCDWYQHS